MKATWPTADEEDKILTRQAAFLRYSLKKFRSQIGKAKKAPTAVSIVVADSYPQWKVDVLLWMQQQYNEERKTFPDTFMKDLKSWAAENVADKKMMKFTMQFAAFMRNEVAEVGSVALDVQLPFDQISVLEGCMEYVKAQLELKELDVLKVESGEAIPDKVKDQATPGSPTLWMR